MTKLLVAPCRTDQWVVHVKGLSEKSSSHEPSIANALSAIPPLPFRVKRGASARRRVEPTLHAPRSHAATLLVVCFALAPLSLCAAVGPNYVRPTNSVPAAYKAAELGAWKEGTPLDNVPKGNWWEIFDDTALNDLEAQALNANQQLKAAIARVDESRATARVARSELLPNLNLDPSWQRQRYSPNQQPSFGRVTASTFNVPLDLSYEVDLWGRVRRSFESARADAQASLAAFYNILLTLQADVAQNYFALRALDAEIATVTGTVDLRKEQVRTSRTCSLRKSTVPV